MSEVKETFDRILDLAGDLAETQKDIAVVKFVEKSTQIGSISIFGAISLVLTAFVLLFAGLGFAWWIGQAVEDLKIGFFIVGGIFTLFLILLLAFSKGIFIPTIRNLLIKIIYED